MPRHNHTLDAVGVGGSGGTASQINGASRDAVGYTGGDQYHNNMPPYYVLYWIIKTI